VGGPSAVRASHEVRKPLQVARAGAVAASAASPWVVHRLRSCGYRAGCTPPYRACPGSARASLDDVPAVCAGWDPGAAAPHPGGEEGLEDDDHAALCRAALEAASGGTHGPLHPPSPGPPVNKVDAGVVENLGGGDPEVREAAGAYSKKGLVGSCNAPWLLRPCVSPRPRPAPAPPVHTAPPPLVSPPPKYMVQDGAMDDGEPDAEAEPASWTAPAWCTVW
jgi:hypothetical protein